MYKPHFLSRNWSQKSRVQLIHGYIKLLKKQGNKRERNWECVAVLHLLFHWVVAPKGVFKCLSANLALPEFFQVIHFRFTRTTKHLQPVTSTHIFLPHAIKYHKIRKYSWGKWPTVLLFFTNFMANSLTALWGSCSAWSFSPIASFETFLYTCYPQRPGSGLYSSQHLKLSYSTCLVFQCWRNFNFMACFEVIILENQIERALFLSLR